MFRIFRGVRIICFIPLDWIFKLQLKKKRIKTKQKMKIKMVIRNKMIGLVSLEYRIVMRGNRAI